MLKFSPLVLGASILVLFFAACARTGLQDFVDVDRDGEPDSGVPRADGGGFDCSQDAECDDGLACNGSERCTVGACEPGAPIDCDDGDPCTIDACDEGGNGCTRTVRDDDMDGSPSVSCGGADCDDGDPARSPGLVETCAGGVDEDCDGDVDCADADCAGTAACCAARVESCANRTDDDCDGAIDCADPDCAGRPGCELCLTIELCVGGRDWDCDGLYGCDDPGCARVCGRR